MADLNNLLSPFFLNDKELRKIIELLFFSYRDFTAGPDKILEQLKFGRAHHRVIYFVGKKNHITIKELLVVLQITKQSLSRVLNQLVSEKFIIVSTGIDKRTKKLSLTEKGKKLENELSTIQINKIRGVINKFSEDNINGFKKILYDMIEVDNKKTFQKIND
jgi:DNA-binding MarR family transcriptional regulator